MEKLTKFHNDKANLSVEQQNKHTNKNKDGFISNNNDKLNTLHIYI